MVVEGNPMASGASTATYGDDTAADTPPATADTDGEKDELEAVVVIG